MNPSVDKESRIDPPIASGLDRPRNWWPAAAGLLAFPLIQYGLGSRSVNFLLSMVAVLAGYFISIYLFKAVAARVLEGHMRILGTVAVLAVLIAAAVTPPQQVTMAVANTMLIPLAAGVVGYRAREHSGPLNHYLIGLAVVTLGGVVMFAPMWPELMNLIRAVGQENVNLFERNLVTMGYHPDAADEYAQQFGQVVDGVARLVPAATMMNLLTQFTVGFLWFGLRDLSRLRPREKLAPFTRWKVPFGAAIPLIAVILARLWGGETITLMADNLMLILSIFYCVGGLALIQSLLEKIKLPVLVKVLFYIMLTLTGMIGFVVTVLLGFVDSFADWRKVSKPAIELEKK